MLAALSGQTIMDLAGIPELKAHQGITYQGLCW